MPVCSLPVFPSFDPLTLQAQIAEYPHDSLQVLVDRLLAMPVSASFHLQASSLRSLALHNVIDSVVALVDCRNLPPPLVRLPCLANLRVLPLLLPRPPPLLIRWWPRRWCRSSPPSDKHRSACVASIHPSIYPTCLLLCPFLPASPFLLLLLCCICSLLFVL